jgi:DNA-binding PadR family transcriptional regulator
MTRLPHTSEQAAILFRILLETQIDWHHGYALMQATGLKSGSLYPLLIRLADDGFLESEWETPDSDNRPRRLYRLTATGRALAHERIARFEARQGKLAAGQKAGA